MMYDIILNEIHVLEKIDNEQPEGSRFLLQKTVEVKKQI